MTDENDVLPPSATAAETVLKPKENMDKDKIEHAPPAEAILKPEEDMDIYSSFANR